MEITLNLVCLVSTANIFNQYMYIQQFSFPPDLSFNLKMFERASSEIQIFGIFWSQEKHLNKVFKLLPSFF